MYFYFNVLSQLFADASNTVFYLHHKGVVTMDLSTGKDDNFRIIEVPGHYSHCMTWTSYSDKVSLIVFVASLSCYDEWNVQNGNQNRMTEQLNLFSRILSEEKLIKVPILLLLNKKDLFRRKIQSVPLTVCPSFTSYDRPIGSYKWGLECIRNAFLSLNHWESRQLDKGAIAVRHIESIDPSNFAGVRRHIERHYLKRNTITLEIIGVRRVDSHGIERRNESLRVRS